MKRKRFIASFPITMVLLLLIMTFQNCSPTEFKEAPVYLNDDQSLSASGASCLFNGYSIPHAESVTAFKKSSVPFGETCEPYTLTCKDGDLPGSATAPFSSCVIGAPSCNTEGWFKSGSTFLDGNAATSAVTPNRVVVSGDFVYVITICGIFRSTDRGNSFENVNFPDGNLSGNAISSFYADGKDFYISAKNNLYKWTASNQQYRIVLTMDQWLAIIQRVRSCSSVGGGSRTFLPVAYAKGPLIVIGHGSGIVVSTDGGASWNRAKFLIGEYEINHSSIRVIEFKGKIFASLPITIQSVYTSTKQCVFGEQAHALLGGRNGAGIFEYANDGKTFNLTTNSPGLAWAIATNGQRLVAFSARPTKISGLLQDVSLYQSSNGHDWVPVNTRLNLFWPWTLNFVGNDLLAGWSDFMTRTDLSSPELTQVLPKEKVRAFAANGNNVYVMTDKGLKISRDGGLTFPTSKTFSSPFCGANTLSSGGGVSVANYNEELFISHNEAFQKVLITKSGLVEIGEQFPSSFDHVPSDVVGFGSTLVSNGPRVSTDGGKTWSGVMTEARIPGRTEVVRSASSVSPNLYLYVSEDGSNQLTPAIQNLEASLGSILSAHSYGSRLITSFHGGGVLVFENGVEIARHPIFESSGNGRSIKRINNTIYVLSKELWASQDNGLTFQIVPSAPFSLRHLFAIRGRILGFTNGLFTISKDDGKTFYPWRGCLE
jgi:hypothetical protein